MDCGTRPLAGHFPVCRRVTGKAKEEKLSLSLRTARAKVNLGLRKPPKSSREQATRAKKSIQTNQHDKLEFNISS